MTCESESDQRHYDRLTATGYPLTDANKKWLAAIRLRNGKRFTWKP